MKKSHQLAALTTSAILAVGCGAADKTEKEPKGSIGTDAALYEPIRVPVGKTDLGLSITSLGDYEYGSHSFVVANNSVGKVTCGAVIWNENRYEGERVLIPAGSGFTQVDCLRPGSWKSVPFDIVNDFASVAVKDIIIR